MSASWIREFPNRARDMLLDLELALELREKIDELKDTFLKTNDVELANLLEKKIGLLEKKLEILGFSSAIK